MESPLLLAFYLGSSSGDVALRHAWLSARASPSLQNVSEALSIAVREFCPHATLQPWDARWHGDETAEDESLAARLALWLHVLVQRAGDETADSTTQQLSALKYSQLVTKRKYNAADGNIHADVWLTGRVAESVTDAPSVTQLSMLLRLLDETLHATLRLAPLAPEQVDALRSGMAWRSHLHNYAATCPLTNANASRVAVTLALHVRWLVKRLLRHLTDGPATRELQALALEMSKDDHHSALGKLARKTLPRLGRPLPVPNLAQITAWEATNRSVHTKKKC